MTSKRSTYLYQKCAISPRKVPNIGISPIVRLTKEGKDTVNIHSKFQDYTSKILTCVVLKLRLQEDNYLKMWLLIFWGGNHHLPTNLRRLAISPGKGVRFFFLKSKWLQRMASKLPWWLILFSFLIFLYTTGNHLLMEWLPSINPLERWRWRIYASTLTKQ